MKFLVVLAVAVACAAADVAQFAVPEPLVPIIKSSYDSSPDGSAFQYLYETANGIYAQADGVVKYPAPDVPTLEVKGSYKYTSPDGTPIETVYVSNENGFYATGDHIPVAPPIPELIQRSLAYTAARAVPVPEKL